MPDATLTIDEVITLARALHPASINMSTNYAEMCSTPIITSIIDRTGKQVELELKAKSQNMKTYAGCYIRVSTTKQRSNKSVGAATNKTQDGFSEDDQLERNIAYCIHNKMAFRIFSDAGLGGDKPFRDPDLIAKILNKKAKRFAKIFNVVFLPDDVDSRWTPEQRSDLKAYMRSKVQFIRQNWSCHEDEELLALMYDIGDPIVPTAPVTRKHRARVKVGHDVRPGLTLMISELNHIHTIVVTDMSRLSRDSDLTVELADRFCAKKVDVIGTIQPVPFFADRTLAGGLITHILSAIAEERLSELITGALRGILEKLRQNRLHGTIPFFMTRQADGSVVANEKIAVVKRMVNLYLEGEGGETIGSKRVKAILEREGPNPASTGDWTYMLVQRTLKSTFLYGKAMLFGLEWRVCDPLLDDETLWKLKNRLAERSATHNYSKPQGDGHLGQGLFRCSCPRKYALGYNQHHLGGGQYDRYSCRITVDSRVDKSIPHVNINAPHLEGWLENLMATHSNVFLSAFTSSSNRTALQRAINEAESAQFAVEKEYDRQELSCRGEAQAMAVKVGFSEGDDGYEDVVTGFIKRCMADMDARRLLARRAVVDARLQMETQLPINTNADTLPERIECWATLNTLEKNAVLRSIFKSFQVAGVPPNEHMEVTLTTGLRLPDLPLRTTGEVSFRRRLVSPEVWFAEDYHELEILNGK